LIIALTTDVYSVAQLLITNGCMSKCCIAKIYALKLAIAGKWEYIWDFYTF